MKASDVLDRFSVNFYHPSPSAVGDVSSGSLADASSSSPGDASSAAANDTSRVCTWCQRPMIGVRPDALFCGVKCRQTAWRFRSRLAAGVGDGSPRRMAYADPPYPGKAKECYGREASYAGEVDHAALIASLVDQYDGWALSTGAYALRDLLPLCPPTVKVCPWVKPIGVSGRTFGLHNAWEPIIVSPGRQLRPGVRDWVSAQPARKGGTLIGRKPIAFCSFLFAAMGLMACDELVDLFPGTGVVMKAWGEFRRTTS